MRALVVTAALLLAPASAASAQAPGEPWDGQNPFDCELQQAGEGTDFPDPDADPFCVEYDKRNQNITEAGVVYFMLLEPARVAAALPKCFYYQHDHWVGSVVQDDGRTRTYAWTGSYYFDRAKGAGGVHVQNFTIAGQAGNPTELPGFPDEWRPYFGAGRGGFHYPGGGEVDPSCVAKAQERDPYRKPPPTEPAGPRCPNPGGKVGRSIGDLELGLTRRETIARRGEPPLVEHRGFLRFCIIGGAKYMAGFPSNRRRARAEFLYTTNPAFHVRRVRRLTPLRQARDRLPRMRLLVRTRRGRLFTVARRDHTLLVLVRRGRVFALASAERSLPTARLARYFRRTAGSPGRR